jgi:hypothetical protein
MLADGTLFLPGCCAFPWGRASAPAGVAPEALQKFGCSSKVFSQRLSVCEVSVLAGINSVSAGLGGAIRMHQHSSAFGAYPGSVAVHRAPRAWAHSRRSRRALRFVCTPCWGIQEKTLHPRNIGFARFHEIRFQVMCENDNRIWLVRVNLLSVSGWMNLRGSGIMKLQGLEIMNLWRIEVVDLRSSGIMNLRNFRSRNLRNSGIY